MLQGRDVDKQVKLLKDRTSWMWSRPIFDYIERHNIPLDAYLDLFIHLMRFLYPCIPTCDGAARAGSWLFLPFIIDAVYLPDQLRDLCA